MTGKSSGSRIAIIWSAEAQRELRAIDREAAMQILSCVDRYSKSREGNVKKLQPPLTGFRLRCGDYRLVFEPKGEHMIEIASVRHRSKAYR